MKELKVATSLLGKGQARRAWTVDDTIVIDNIIFADLTDLSPKSHGNTQSALSNLQLKVMIEKNIKHTLLVKSLDIVCL